MRMLLRNALTGLYVQSAGEWTAKPDEALDFKTMGHAIRFAERVQGVWLAVRESP